MIHCTQRLKIKYGCKYLYTQVLSLTAHKVKTQHLSTAALTIIYNTIMTFQNILFHYKLLQHIDNNFPSCMTNKAARETRYCNKSALACVRFTSYLWLNFGRLIFFSNFFYGLI